MKRSLCDRKVAESNVTAVLWSVAWTLAPKLHGNVDRWSAPTAMLMLHQQASVEHLLSAFLIREFKQSIIWNTRNAPSPKHYILKDPRGAVTCICDKHFFSPLVSLQKYRHITQQTRPKTTTWHFADPRSFPPDREKGGGGGRDDSSFRSDIKHRRESEKKRGGRKRLHLCRDSLLEKPGKCRAISLSFSLSLPPSIYPSLPLCVSLSLFLSHQNLPPIRISASHALWMGYENTRRTQGVNAGIKVARGCGVIVVVQIDRPPRLQWLLASPRSLSRRIHTLIHQGHFSL